eukprot:21002-Heterococcus_DN1.PRE.1
MSANPQNAVDSDAPGTLAHREHGRRWRPPRPAAVAQRLRGLFEKKREGDFRTSFTGDAQPAAHAGDIEEAQALPLAEPHYPGPAAEPFTAFSVADSDEEKSELSELAYDPEKFVSIGEQTPMISPSAEVTAAATTAATTAATAAATAAAATAASAAAAGATPASTQTPADSHGTSQHTSESQEESTPPEVVSILVEPAQQGDTGVLNLGFENCVFALNLLTAAGFRRPWTQGGGFIRMFPSLHSSTQYKQQQRTAASSFVNGPIMRPVLHNAHKHRWINDSVNRSCTIYVHTFLRNCSNTASVCATTPTITPTSSTTGDAVRWQYSQQQQASQQLIERYSYTHSRLV